MYLTGFDHWCKEELKCRYYYRYADDIVILGESKAHLRNVLVAIKLYLKHVLKLGVKGNYQIFPVESRRFTDKEKRLSKYAACEYLNASDNVDQKIIESAIIFWFKDVDCKAENKVVEYLGEY